MKLKNYLIVFTILVVNNALSEEKTPFKNMLILEEPKIYKEIIFQDRDGMQIDLNKVNTDKIYILNFWATWCAPCREEMPSLDKLQEKNGIFIFPINLEEKNLQKTEKFYKDLNIKNLNTYFDDGLKLVKVFALRGVPTTIILNKNKELIARISGSVDFADKNFVSWLDSVR
ncbi:TlpA family protein disulfide reductase [Candidatus Pelagibacter sp.]|nr:TlpA family protein disulfide reductase [Candidatus Pelagibacter sp.]